MAINNVVSLLLILQSMTYKHLRILSPPLHLSIIKTNQ